MRTLVVVIGILMWIGGVTGALAGDGPGVQAGAAPALGSAGASAGDVAVFETEALDLINAYRAEHGLAALKQDTILDEMARKHSAYMASKDELSHENFPIRFFMSGSERCAENVGWNYSSPGSLFTAWRSSGEHDRNMLAPDLTRAALAKSGKYVTFLGCR